MTVNTRHCRCISKPVGLLLLGLTLTGCGSSPPAASDPTQTITVATAATVATTIAEVPTGTATVTEGEATFEFIATRCLVAADVFVVDGVSADGDTTVAIRHASPPTRAVPEPSMSYLLIEPDPGFASAPASVNFETYDPATGVASGSVDQGVTFTVRCDR